MKILMINGSPHPRGCTYTALHEMERVLRAAGAEVQILTVGDEQMGGCVACGGCRATGRCVRGGLVNDAIDAMETADALVLASPVHYAGISGAMSAFCDRLFYASDGWANKPCACAKRRSPTMTAGPSVPLRRRASATTLPFRALARFSPCAPQMRWK